MVGWHHRLNRHEFEQTLGNGEGQGSLGCCSPWGHKESDTTEHLNNEGRLRESRYFLNRKDTPFRRNHAHRLPSPHYPYSPTRSAVQAQHCFWRPPSLTSIFTGDALTCPGMLAFCKCPRCSSMKSPSAASALAETRQN